MSLYREWPDNVYLKKSIFELFSFSRWWRSILFTFYLLLLTIVFQNGPSESSNYHMSKMLCYLASYFHTLTSIFQNTKHAFNYYKWPIFFVNFETATAFDFWNRELHQTHFNLQFSLLGNAIFKNLAYHIKRMYATNPTFLSQ